MATVTKRAWTYKGETKTAWVVRWKASGKHPSKQFDLKRDADKYRLKVERELEDGVHLIERESPKMVALCDEFIRAQEQRQRDGRIGAGYLVQIKTAVERDIVPFLGTIRVKDLEIKHVLDLYNAMRQREQIPTIGLGKVYTPRRGLSPKTARERIGILKMILDYAMVHDYTKRDIMPAVASQLRGVPAAKVKTFDLDMMRGLLETVETRSVRGRLRAHALIRCFVYLAAFGGLRVGEIYGLTRENIMLDEQVIRVRHSLTNQDLLKGPKTKAGIRDVAVPKHVAQVLREWLATYYVPNDRNLVFRMEAGERIRPGTFHTSYWRPLLKRAGLTSTGPDCLHFHALRHFAASWMIHNGVSVVEVASRMGHESFDTTLGVYAHTIIGTASRADEADAMATRLAHSRIGGQTSETPIPRV